MSIFTFLSTLSGCSLLRGKGALFSGAYICEEGELEGGEAPAGVSDGGVELGER